MTIILYHYPASPPSRIALTTAKALGLSVEVKIVDLATDDQYNNEFLKKYPLHTVPTLDDNGFIVVDSHAIAAYLVSQYGRDDSLYPRDPKKKALVDQRLYFDTETLFPTMRGIVSPMFFLGKTSVDPQLRRTLYKSVAVLEEFLEPTGWLAGEQPTIADISCAVTILSVQVVGAEFRSYPRTRDWLQRCMETISGFREANEEGLTELSTAKIPIGQFLPESTEI